MASYDWAASACCLSQQLYSCMLSRSLVASFVEVSNSREAFLLQAMPCCVRLQIFASYAHHPSSVRCVSQFFVGFSDPELVTG